MELKEIIELITSNGMSAIIIGYFIYKDNTTSKALVQAINEMKSVLTTIKVLIKGDFDNE